MKEKKRKNLRAERIISNALHPMACGGAGLFVAGYDSNVPIYYFLENILLGLTLFFFVPLIFFFFLIKKGIVGRTLFLREERYFLFLLLGIMCFIGAGLFFILERPRMVAVSLMCALLSTALLVLNTKWKVSWHITGNTSLAVLLVIAFGPIGYFYFALIPVVGWARYQLKAHTIWEMVLGFLTSTFITEGVLLLTWP